MESEDPLNPRLEQIDIAAARSFQALDDRTAIHGRARRLWMICSLISLLSASPALGHALPAQSLRPLAGTGASVVPVAVFGEDDRGPVPPELMTARDSIGLLYNGKAQIVCTAFCVAPDVIATAAHCLFRTADDRPPSLSDFVFARSRDQTEGASRIAGHATRSIGQNIASGNMQIRVRPPIDAASDWALIRLAAPSCKSTLPVTALTNDEIARAAEARQIFQLSYHRDYANWDMAYSKPCDAAQSFGDVTPAMVARDFSNPQALILHRCDTGGASSGSPLLLAGPDGPQVVGINVGTYVLSRTLIRDSGSAQRLRQDVIANTAVNATVFQTLIPALRGAAILAGSAPVRRLQQLLADLHHYAGPLDGNYGPLLRAAIQDFELTQGLPVTGLASQELLSLIEKASLVARKQAFPESANVPTAANSRVFPRAVPRETTPRR